MFLQTLGHGFVSWDDPSYVKHNSLVTGQTSASWSELLTTPQLGYPMPVTVLSYRIEYALFGPRTIIFHATNLLLHLVNCLLLFALARRLGLALAASLAAMLLFGLHPAVAEPVSWISGRKDLLAVCFGLLAVLDSHGHPWEPRRLRSWAAAGLFALGLLCKPTVLFLALLLPLWRWGLQGVRPRRAAFEALPMALPVLVVVPLAFYLHHRSAGMQPGWQSTTEQLRLLWYALGFHLGLLSLVVTPAAKHVPHPWPPPFDPVLDLLPLIWALGLGLVLRRVGSRQRPIALAGLAWAALAYLPYANIVPLTRFTADSYLYAPLVGWALLLGAVVDHLVERASSRRGAILLASCGVLGVGSLAVLVFVASAKYDTSYSLWLQAYEQYPHDYRLCRNVGNGLHELGHPKLALERYLNCADRFGRDAFEKNLAITYFALQDYPRARRLFDKLQRQRPNDRTVCKYVRMLDAMKARSSP